ncbi:tRNA-yW synthesizing protein 5 [Phyllostomus discolor]|uniref:tRNA-yW synthesizing protein 5 n=1 Tax=Phyllostomus discolor TaxID=89673 RepID=A0A834ALQ6_9CHIR|nr:tRNA-yW synthesizing protein 5 [Phyllostomus discolor]
MAALDKMSIMPVLCLLKCLLFLSMQDVADIRKQFPLLEGDIKFPKFFKEEQFFSSVFRISSPGLQLWTHYDVMDNFLIQVKGKKRVVLFSPRDAQYLYLSGTKSEVLNIDNPDLAKYPLFSKARSFMVP